MSKSTRVIAFDLDGTLVDSLDDITAGLRGAIPVRPLDRDEVRRFVGRGARYLVDQALRYRELPHAERDVDAALERFYAAYDAALGEYTRAFDGIPAVLARLEAEGFALVVTTNKPGAFARRVVAACLPNVMRAVIGPDDAGAHKPDPAMLQVAGERARGEVVCLVGDSLVDAATAAAAGVPSVSVSWGLEDSARLRAADTRWVERPEELAQAILAAVASGA